MSQEARSSPDFLGRRAKLPRRGPSPFDPRGKNLHFTAEALRPSTQKPGSELMPGVVEWGSPLSYLPRSSHLGKSVHPIILHESMCFSTLRNPQTLLLQYRGSAGSRLDNTGACMGRSSLPASLSPASRGSRHPQGRCEPEQRARVKSPRERRPRDRQAGPGGPAGVFRGTLQHRPGHPLLPSPPSSSAERPAQPSRAAQTLWSNHRAPKAKNSTGASWGLPMTFVAPVKCTRPS